MSIGDYLKHQLPSPADSSGKFSIDVTRAEALLRQHRLSEPREYILALLTSAVAGGATYFQADFGRSTTTLSWDGRPWSNDHLTDLLSRLLRPGEQEPYLNELAIGLNALLALKPVELTLESAGGGRQVWKGSSATILEPAKGEGNRISFTENVGLLASFGRRRDEPEILRARGSLAPLKLQVDGKLVTSAALLKGFNESLASVVKDAPARTGSPYSGKRLSGNGPTSRLVWISGSDYPIQIVMQGVSYTIANALPAGAIVWHPGMLPRDLSFRLRETPELQALLAVVEEDMWRALGSLSSNSFNHVRLRAFTWAHQVAEDCRESRPQRSEELYCRLLEFAKLEGRKLVLSWNGLLAVLKETGRSEQAVDILSKLAARLEGAAAILAYEQLLPLLRKHFGQESRQVLEALCMLARLRPNLADYRDQARALWETMGEPDKSALKHLLPGPSQSDESAPRVLTRAHCLRCGSDRIMENGSLGDAVWYGGAESFALSAAACADCGHIEMTLKNPAQAAAAYYGPPTD